MLQGQQQSPADRLSRGKSQQLTARTTAHAHKTLLQTHVYATTNYFLRQNCHYHYVCLCCC